MDQETQDAEKPLSVLAKETYGDDYVGEVPPEDGEDESEKPELTIESAYEELQDAKDAEEQPADDGAGDDPDAAATDDAPAADHVDDNPIMTPDGGLTMAGAEALGTLRQDAMQFEADRVQLGQAKQTDLNALAQTDRARAVAIAQDIQRAEQELTQRHAALTQRAESIVGEVQEHNGRGAKKALADERRQLDKAMPNLDMARLETYLTKSLGFDAKLVANVTDHKLVAMAEKARRYDEAKAKVRQAPRKATKQRRDAEDGDYQETLAHAQRTGHLEDHAALLHMKRPAARAPTIKQLDAQLTKTGSMDDALALLTARRGAA